MRRHPGLVGLRVAVPLVLVGAVLLLSRATRSIESTAASSFPIRATRSWQQWQSIPASLRAGLPTDLVAVEPPVPLPFEEGETLGGVLKSLGLSGPEAYEIATRIGEFVDVRKLRPNDRYLVRFDEGRMNQFELVVDGRGRMIVDRAGNGWRGSWRAFDRTRRRLSVNGELQGPLESSIARAGGPESLAVLMADVFQWDLDFTRDLRVGDTFSLLYETVHLDGAYYGVGAILAAVYVNDGRRLEAYQFGDEGQYYDAEGRPTRKMFLRSPLRYSRVTSRFSRRRFHPVLKRYRPHYGVDYGAPVGTPVRATAAGRVALAGWDGGGGRTVKLRHANGYLTAYLHLSRFASGIAAGRRVAQGEVIGYVGSSGLSTAPHLDYRVQRQGRWMDPLSLRSVPADPIPDDRLAEFMERRDLLRASLGATTLVAGPSGGAVELVEAAAGRGRGSSAGDFGAAQ